MFSRPLSRPNSFTVDKGRVGHIIVFMSTCMQSRGVLTLTLHYRYLTFLLTTVNNSVFSGGISRTPIWRTGVAGIDVPDAPLGRLGGALINIVLPGWRLCGVCPNPRICSALVQVRCTFLSARSCAAQDQQKFHYFTHSHGTEARARARASIQRPLGNICAATPPPSQLHPFPH